MSIFFCILDFSHFGQIGAHCHILVIIAIFGAQNREIKIQEYTPLCQKKGETGHTVVRHTHTGVVSENMHTLGAKLRKLPRQAKICTPPGGDACRV